MCKDVKKVCENALSAIFPSFSVIFCLVFKIKLVVETMKLSVGCDMWDVAVYSMYIEMLKIRTKMMNEKKW